MSAGEALTKIKAEALDFEAYSPYGQVIQASERSSWRPANMGTSKRFDHLCKLDNLRDLAAKLNVCIFQCSPLSKLPLEMKLLEKHEHSTQAFIPMDKSCRYLAIVCLGQDAPDLNTLKAFIVEGACGISYFPGVWHYPMTALDSQIDFTCLVYEDGSKADCTVVQLKQTILIELE